jgi:arabinogalactan endo-1,4-beta-galactosidase
MAQTLGGAAGEAGSQAPGGGEEAVVSGGRGGDSAGGVADAGAPSSIVSGGGNGGNGGSGGDAGGRATGSFFLGADISSSQETNLTYRDVDGTELPLLQVLRNHGFNYIRLKTFVDPSAPHGYASSENGCPGLAESFGDKAHVIALGKQVKDAGMGLMLDFHYSDTWADPGKQIIPKAWRGAANIVELAALMKAYTSDVITSAIAAGARPDIAQIGNEITPGILMHLPGPKTDCWGNSPVAAPFGGSASNWENLASLLKAGIEGVREVDPTIKIMLHIENTNVLSSVRGWVDNARSHGVSFDILGLSCYTAFQGQPAVWQNTFNDLASRYPDLSFTIAEYNPERTRANQVVLSLPAARGLGTFFWEPTKSGVWGGSLFSIDNVEGTAQANAIDFAEFDAMKNWLPL